MLDPSCGDGRFLMWHRSSVGVEQDQKASAIAHERAPWSLIHERDFFIWADKTEERFECAAGNPPFIRYQRFAGDVRARALTLSARLGVTFTALTSSWAPFLVVTASLLKPGGRLAFVVPAEIGHCQYAPPLIRYFLGHFKTLHLIAVQHKI
jgi:adenine-specific DNA-methyltransferase